MKPVCLCAILTLSILCGFPQPARAQGDSDGAAQILFQLANRDRADQGLRPLKWSSALARAAQQHASLMAQRNELTHQFRDEPTVETRASRAGEKFSSLAENVAEGPSPDQINKQWMESPPHRANLLDPQLDSVGIAVAQHNGILFAVEDFSLSLADLSIGEQEKTVNAQLQAHGLRLLSYVDDARKSCALDNGYAGTHEPSFIVHYATTDLQSLPDILEKKIETGQYHAAVVGACPSVGKTGVANYRVAVLLFE